MRTSAPCTITLVVCSVLLQRLAIPLGADQVPAMVPIGLALLTVGLYTGELRVARSRLPVLALIWATVAACTLAQLVLGEAPSLLSVGLFVALYAMLGLSADITQGAARRAERVFVGLMCGLAVVSMGQMLGQLSGWQYEDLLGTVVPSGFLLRGYNTGDPIAYGEALIRSDGIVFLEPSFLSIFLGLAAALALYRGWSMLVATLLLAGMVPPLAGSGMVVLVPALLVIAVLRPRHLLKVVPAVLIAVLVATLTPLGERYLERSTEASDPRTSSSARLIQPYSELLPPSVEDPQVTLVGHGAGSADDFLIDEGLYDVTAPIIPKVLYEYGVLGIVGVLMALVLCLALGVRGHPWAVGLLLLYVYVNASFLQHTQVFLTLFWLLLMPPEPLRALAGRAPRPQEPTPEPRPGAAVTR
ncbi:MULTISPECIES: hypothetical protein [unclassified Blastococcus]